MKTLNTRPNRFAGSRFKGVFAHGGHRGWRAEFYPRNAKKVYIGSFATEEDAARAYDEAALRLGGPDVFLNLRDMELKTKPVIDGPCTFVPLNTGQRFCIDTEDLDRVGLFYWTRHSETMKGCCGRRQTQLHTLLLGVIPPAHAVVHLNGDVLDCRKRNLAVVPRTLHSGRQRKRKAACSSIYKGVKLTSDRRWSAQIASKHLGIFEHEVEAASAYDDAARLRFGIFAALNFPREGEVSCLAEEPSQLAA